MFGKSILGILTPSDARFYNHLFSMKLPVTLPENEITVATVRISAKVEFVNKELMSFIYTAFPYFLEEVYGLKDETVQFKNLKKEFLSYLENAIPSFGRHTELKPIVIKLKHFPKQNTIALFGELIIQLKKFIYKDMPDPDKKVFLLFYKFMKEKAYDQELVNKIVYSSLMLTDDKVRKVVKHLETDKYASAKEDITKETEQLFGTATPSTAQLEKLMKKNPEAYKAWRTRMTAVRREAKKVLTSYWHDKKLDLVTPKEARAICEELDIECPIDKKYVGYVSLGDSPSILFKYFTKYKRELNGTPGKDVVMNDKYTDDTTYYCSSLPAGSFTNMRHNFYTQDFIKKSSTNKFDKVRLIAPVIEDCRAAFLKDIKSKDDITKVSAFLCLLADHTCGRIGNSESEKEKETFGLHNLLRKNLKITENSCILSYVGKDHQDQRHVVTDPLLVKYIKKFAEGKKPKEYLFTTPKMGNKKINPKAVNKYLTSIGFPATFHAFRKYHASRTFVELTRDQEINEKNGVKIYEEALKKIAFMLGNTPPVVMRSYVDPDLTIIYFKKNNIKMPTKVENTIKKVKEGGIPDDEE